MSSAGDVKVVGINSLPAELLLKILALLCTPSETSHHLRLIAACSRWRQLLLATPTIWRTICIASAEWKSQDAYQRFLLRLETQLIRSGSQRLHVHLQVGPPRGFDLPLNSIYEPGLSPLARLLERCAPFPAWETLTLQQCSPGMLNELHLGRMGGFINLKSLYLRDLLDPLFPILSNSITNAFRSFDCLYFEPCPFDGQAYVRSFSNILSRITCLRIPHKFSGSTTGLKLPPNITTVYIIVRIPNTVFPYVQSVHITPADLKDSIPALSLRFPNLCSLSLATYYDPFIPAISSHEFPNLEHLVTQGSAYSILSCLVSPQLQKLTIRMNCPELDFGLGGDDIHQKHSNELLLSKVLLETSLRPKQEFSILSPVPFHVLNAAFRCCAMKAKKIRVSISSKEESLKVLSKLFCLEEGECVEGTEDNQSVTLQLPLHLEHLDLFLDFRLDDEIISEWNQCLGRFVAWTSAAVRSLRTIQVAWKGGETRRIIV